MSLGCSESNAQKDDQVPMEHVARVSQFLVAPDAVDSLFNLGRHMFVLWTSTAKNTSIVILPNYNENRATALFDIIFLAVSTYIFMNIFTAIMYNQFRGYLVSSFQKRLFRRRVAVRAAFEILKSRDPVPVVEVDKIIQLLEKTSMPDWKKSAISATYMQKYEGRPLKMVEFMDLFRLLDLSSPPKKVHIAHELPTFVRHLENPVASRIQALLLSNACRKFELFIAFANVLCIILQLVAFEDENFTFFMINACFAIIYMIEIGIRLWVHGFRNCFRKTRSLCDIIFSTINLALRIVELALIILSGSHSRPFHTSPYDIGQWANLCVILRTLIFMHVSDLMTLVILKMPQHLAPVLGVLTSFYYVYALLGLTLFHGAISPPINGTNASYVCGTYQQLGYWSINFDDFAASIFTLWSLMVLNNWHVIVHAFTEKLGRWVHIYMLSWWLLAAVILLTLITAMIIESFLFARQSVLGEKDRSHSYNSNRRRKTCCLGRLNRRGNNDAEPLVNAEVEIQANNSSETPQEAGEIQVITLEVSGEQRDNIRLLSHPPPPASMFGGNFTGPTMEELEQHLVHHFTSLKVSRRGSESQVVLVELSRSDTFNTLCPQMMKELAEVVKQFEQDSSMRCLVLTGGNKFFSVGAEIQQLHELRKPEVMQQWKTLDSASKPTIAAVNGVALGGGAELALACDIIYVGERARFGFPEIGLGILPGAGGTQRIVRAVGKSRAMEMILSGKTLSAKEAVAYGLASSLHPVTEVVDSAVSLAERISSHSLVALRAAKKAVNAAFQMSLDEGLQLERELFLKALSSNDGQEGIRAHLEKRLPKYAHK
ncbi:hypothetical protein Aperf_G00000005868 [Anoplocephala perfoliata]